MPHRIHLAITTSGFPFSTMYVASSAPLPLPTFLAAWIVPAGMNRTPPGLSVTGGLPSTCVLQRTFEDVDNLFAWMRVPAECHPGVELDAHLDDLASRSGKIVPLEIGAPDARLLRPRHVQRYARPDDECRQRDGSCRLHVQDYSPRADEIRCARAGSIRRRYRHLHWHSPGHRTHTKVQWTDGSVGAHSFGDGHEGSATAELRDSRPFVSIDGGHNEQHRNNC